MRQGQEEGTIRRQSQTATIRNQFMESGVVPRGGERQSPRDIFSNSREAEAAYAMTDGVAPEDFDAAIDEARAEGNLSRANVVRKHP